MTNAGDINNDDIVPSLRGGENVILNNPWVFLPPGTTAERPTPSSTINYRLRFNTDDQVYEYYDAVSMQWVQLDQSATTAGPFLIYTADASLPDAQNLGLLANGLLKQTITLGSATLDIAVLDTDYYGPGMTGYIQAPAGIKDANGNIVMQFNALPSAVNYYNFVNSPAGFNPNLYAAGADTDIGISIVAKGAGSNIISSLSNTPLKLDSGTGYQHQTIFSFSDTPFTRTVTFQDADGTVAYLSDIPAGTPSALTKTDDTNVTLSLGGTPATALLQATSLTLGWTGTLSGTRGGTGVNNGSNTATFAGNLNFANSFTTSGNFEVTQTYTGITNVTFPTSGTLATTSQIPTGAALTKTDDTNVTLTLGGSPTTALVNAASLTLGWTGQLSLTRGGTNASLTASNGGIFYSTATAGAILSGTATAQQLLMSGASTTPQWSTTTYPLTNAINTIMYASSANVLGVITPVNSAVLISSAGGVPSMSTTLPSGIAATNMNLTTPTLGVASATSINFGGTALSVYAEGTFTPTVTLVGGAGNTVPVYSTNTGTYTRIGDVVFVTVLLTGDGGAEGAGTGTFNVALPFTAAASGNLDVGPIGGSAINNATRFQLLTVINGGATTVSLFYWSSISAISAFTGDLQNNTTRSVKFQFWYYV